MITRLTQYTAIAWFVALGSDAPRRALPPKWSPAHTAPFPLDAREQLVGARPATHPNDATSETTAKSSPTAPGHLSAAARDATAVDGQNVWSQRIEADHLLAEIKRLNSGMAAPLVNPTRYKGGGSKICQRNLGVLAVLFAVVEEYEPRLACHESAGVLRSAFARASRNAKAPTDASFAEVRQRKADLDQVLGGQNVDASSSIAPNEDWSELVDRPLLMQHMEILQQQSIEPSLANARQFGREALRVREYAQVLGLLAEVVGRKKFEYSDDEEFLALARQLSVACADLATAAEQKDYEAARSAAGRVTQSCSDCHEGRRG